MLNRTCLASDIIALVVSCQLRYRQARSDKARLVGFPGVRIAPARGGNPPWIQYLASSERLDIGYWNVELPLRKLIPIMSLSGRAFYFQNSFNNLGAAASWKLLKCQCRLRLDDRSRGHESKACSAESTDRYQIKLRNSVADLAKIFRS